MPPKKKTLTLKEKIDVIHFSEKHKKSIREIATEFQVGKTQVADLLKKKNEILSEWQSNSSASHIKRRFVSSSGSLDNIVFEWFCETRNKGFPISGTEIRHKAAEVANRLGLTDFKASSGWLDKFRKRHGISHKNVCGEGENVNLGGMNNFLQKLPAITDGYDPDCIYNTDVNVENDFEMVPEHDLKTNPCNNEYTYGTSSDLNQILPVIPTSISVETQHQYTPTVELKQSPASPHQEAETQCDFAEDSQSMSFHYSSAQEDYEIFGAFIASELRGLGNNFSLIRSVKKKIQLTLLEAYEVYESQRNKRKSLLNDDMPTQQPQLMPSSRDTPIVKIENADDDDLNMNQSVLTHQEPQQHIEGENLEIK